MLIGSIESKKFPLLNQINDISFFGSWIIFICSMLPMYGFQAIIQDVFGRNEIFDLSFTFFLNNLCFHIFLAVILDIRIKFFYVSSILFCLVCTIFNGIRQYDEIVMLLSS